MTCPWEVVQFEVIDGVCVIKLTSPRRGEVGRASGRVGLCTGGAILLCWEANTGRSQLPLSGPDGPTLAKGECGCL